MFENIILAMSSFVPHTALAAATCTLNDQVVPCSKLKGLFSLIFGFQILVFVFIGIMVVSSWFIYEKAHQPGWTSLVPIYNLVKLLEIVGKPTWWLLLMFIPLVNIIIVFIVVFRLAKVFGKGTSFGLGLFFLPVIFSPILAFGKSQYVGININNNPIPPTPNTPNNNL